jgi:hypothetical protein
MVCGTRSGALHNDRSSIPHWPLQNNRRNRGAFQLFRPPWRTTRSSPTRCVRGPFTRALGVCVHQHNAHSMGRTPAVLTVPFPRRSGEKRPVWTKSNVSGVCDRTTGTLTTCTASRRPRCRLHERETLSGATIRMMTPSCGAQRRRRAHRRYRPRASRRSPTRRATGPQARSSSSSRDPARPPRRRKGM